MMTLASMISMKRILSAELNKVLSKVYASMENVNALRMN
jgi:hypothetical protein